MATIFLHLVTCGEILSNLSTYERNDLLHEELLRDFAEIAAKLDDGEKVVNRIKNNFSHVKRRFTLAITSLLSEPFFAHHESREAHCALKAYDIESRVKAAYDLRSRYVHTGISFGHWVGHVTQRVEEVRTGNPVIEDKGFKKIIRQSPTLNGIMPLSESNVDIILLCREDVWLSRFSAGNSLSPTSPAWWRRAFWQKMTVSN